jgi:surface polysaccharide O-acyltransferase-like enzyme
MKQTSLIFNNEKVLIKDSRIYYFDYLRVICSFFVILTHISAEYYYKFNINSNDWKIAYFYNGISRFSLPIFFMISGTLFLGKNISFDIIIRKYIKKIFIHLLLWSIIYSFSKINILKLDVKNRIIHIINGHYHLWYLFVIIGLYILIPFTREIAKNNKLFNDLIKINIIFVFIIPNYIHIFAYYSMNISKLSTYLIKKINLNTLSVHHFYFIFGYYLNNKKNMKKEIIILFYIAGLIGFVFTTFISYNFCIIKQKKNTYCSLDYLTIFFYSSAIFIVFKNHFNTSKVNMNKRIFIKISKFTFGIYLIHPWIIENILRKFNILSLRLNVTFLIPILNLTIFLLSLVICIILFYIPFIGKYLV